MPDMDLKIHASQDGAEQTADALKKVADQQTQVADATAKGAEASEKASDSVDALVNSQLRQAIAQDKAADGQGDLNTGLRQFGRLLDTVVPGLGRLVGGLTSLPTIAGAVIGGLGAIALALQSIEERARAAREEFDKLRDAANQSEKDRLQRQQAIENISDQRRRIGGLNETDSEAAIDTAEQISQRFPSLDREAIDTTVGTFGGIGLNLDQLIEASILMQLGELKVEVGATAEGLRRSLESASKRKASRVQGFVAREDVQSEKLAGQAGKALRSTDEPTAALEEFIRRLPPGVTKNIDPEELARVIQGLSATEGQLIEPKDLLNPGVAKAFGRALIDRAVDPFGSETEHTLNLKAAQLGAEGIPATANLVAIGEQILRELKRANDNPRSVHHHNGKYFGRDAESYANRSKYGAKPTD
jgi:hypothetical protein